MKAMRAHKFGGPEDLCFEDAPEPQVQAGQVKIRVRAAGINPADLVRLAGRFPGLALPYIPGTDVCGEVEEVGAGVALKKGDKVFGRAQGGYAEKTCMAASEAMLLPGNLSFAEGAAIPIPFFTAYHALHHKAALKKGETVLISAGGGGVGVAAIQLAVVAGARVITTVGSAEKAEGVRALGAHTAVNYREEDFVAPDAVFQPSAREHIEHGVLFGQPDRMIQGNQRHSGIPAPTLYARRWGCGTMRRAVVVSVVQDTESHKMLSSMDPGFCRSHGRRRRDQPFRDLSDIS